MGSLSNPTDNITIYALEPLNRDHGPNDMWLS